MPKHEANTPKAIANRIKSKGLQKLKWYCQMCQKQCRDENGFKCHTTSESHQRQLLLFADNPGQYLGSFSHEFEVGYLQHLSRRFGTKRVSANQVYQEYISDRHHLHMNATRWLSLTGFVKHLGGTGKCIVDQTEKGWFITYIDRDPETIRRQEALARKEKMDKDDEERMADFVNKQVEMGASSKAPEKETVYTELVRTSEEEKLSLNLKLSEKTKPIKIAPTENILEKVVPIKKKDEKSQGEKRKKTALDEIMDEQEKSKEKMNRKDYWLAEDIVVKVVAKSLGDKYYKQKGVVEEVRDKYKAIVKMLDSGDVLKIDQAHLETVIPAIGRTVKILNGGYRGCEATLESMNVKKSSCSVTIKAGPLTGRKVDGISYDDVSKLAS